MRSVLGPVAKSGLTQTKKAKEVEANPIERVSREPVTSAREKAKAKADTTKVLFLVFRSQL